MDDQITRRNAHGRVGENLKFVMRQCAREGNIEPFLAVLDAYEVAGKEREEAIRAFWDLRRDHR